MLPFGYFFDRSLRRAAVLLTVCVLCSSFASAQNTGLAFLGIATDAASLGMGSAQTALSSNVFATYWNPAGLGGLSSSSAALTHHVWIEDVRIYTLAAGFKAGRAGGLGVAVTAVGSGDIAVRSGPGDPEGFFDAQFVSTGLSYGRLFGPVSVGVTTKFLSERIFDVSSNGYAFDFGLQVRAMEERVWVGASAQNFGRMSELNVQATELPRTVRAGVGLFPLRIVTRDDSEDFVNSSVVAELVYGLETEETSLRLGAAVQVLETIMLRGGWQTNNALWRFSMGAGVEFETIQFDYAYLPFRSGFGRSGHVLSLLYFW